MERRDFVASVAGTIGAGSLRRPRPGSTGAVGAPLLDAHAHVMSPLVAARISGRRTVEPLSATELIRRMDAAGIRSAAVHSTAYMMATDAFQRDVTAEQERRELETENDFASRECAPFPDRLVPFLSVNPKRDHAIAEIDRGVDRLGMRGLKLHLWNSLVDTRDADQLDRLRRVCEHAANRGLPVLIHAFVGAVKEYGPDDTERLVRQVIEPLPKLRVCLAHAAGAGGFGPATQRCLERLAALCPAGTPLGDRIWIDMAAVLFGSAAEHLKVRFSELIGHWGVGRTLWGSDSFETALADTQKVWPLGDEAWTTVCRNDGARWLTG